MGSHEQSNRSFVKPDVIAVADGDVGELCRRIRRSLDLNHVHCPESSQARLSADLFREASTSRRVLGDRFYKIIVFDARRGMNGRVFDLDRFLRYVFQEMNIAFQLGLDARDYHSELISQILKDEPCSLFCFVGIDLIPYESLQRLRGFTQESHRCLFTGHHDFGARASDSDEAVLLPSDEPFELSDDSSDIRLGDRPSNKGSDVKLVMKTIHDDPFSDESIELPDDSSDIRLDDRPSNKGSDVKLVMTTVDDTPLELSSEGIESLELEVEESEDSEAISLERTNLSEDDDFLLSPVRPLPPDAEFLESKLFEDIQRRQAAMIHQASLLIARKKTDAAMEWLVAVETECRGLRPTENLAACLGHQARLLVANGDRQLALTKLREQQETYAALKMFFPMTECLLLQGELLKQEERRDEALKQFRRAERLARTMRLPSQHVLSLFGQSQIQIARGKWAAALESLRVEERVCRLNGFHPQLVRCLGMQALVLRQSLDLKLALATFEEQARVARQIGDKMSLAISLGSQAAIYETNGEVEMALSVYRASEKICRELANLDLLARNLINQAFCMSKKLNQHADALVRAEEAHQLAIELKLEKLSAQIEGICRDIRQRMAKPNSSTHRN